MDLENKLKRLNDFNISFEIKQGYYHIALQFNEGWDVIMPENESIYVEHKNGYYHYIALIDNVKLDDIFKTIENTIDYNIDLEKKLVLFKEKTEELQKIFANEDYETLQTLEFKLGEKQELKKIIKRAKTTTKDKTPKKTRTKKTTKKEEKQLEEIKENLTKIESVDYDKEEEVVTMSNDFIEELERK